MYTIYIYIILYMYVCVSHDSSIISFAPHLPILRLCKFSLEEKTSYPLRPSDLVFSSAWCSFRETKTNNDLPLLWLGYVGILGFGVNSDFLLTQICGYLWRNHFQDLSPCIPIWLWPNHWKDDPGTHLIQLRKDKDHGKEQVYASCANL